MVNDVNPVRFSRIDGMVWEMQSRRPFVKTISGRFNSAPSPR
jgi:hypothetical protein